MLTFIGQIFSGALTLVTQKLLKSRDDFFKQNVEVEHFSKILGLIQTVSDEEKRFPLIEKIVKGYCDHAYDNTRKHNDSNPKQEAYPQSNNS